MGRRSGLLAGDRFVGNGIFTEFQVHSREAYMKIGKVDCKAMRVVLLATVFVVKRRKACGGCLGTRRRGRPW